MKWAIYHAAALRVLNGLALSLDADPATVDRAVYDAYPFGLRAHWPYKAWLRAVREWKADRAKMRAWTRDSVGAEP